MNASTATRYATSTIAPPIRSRERLSVSVPFATHGGDGRPRGLPSRVARFRTAPRRAPCRVAKGVEMLDPHDVYMNYLVPTVVEQSSRGERAYDIYSRL